MSNFSFYTVQPGDTFESIARKNYGTGVPTSALVWANPGQDEPLIPGTAVFIPVLPEVPQNQPQAAEAGTVDEVALLIKGERFRYPGRVRITHALDQISTIEFSTPFESDAPDFRRIFRPYSYPAIEVTVGGTLLFTGTLLITPPTLGQDQKILNVAGYATPGVLADCTVPASALPLEFEDATLKTIATTLARFFGLTTIFRAEPGAVFERVAIEPGLKVQNFLMQLAQQRNLVITSGARGELVFQRSIETGVPVAQLAQGEAPVLGVSPIPDAQGYYSHITGFEPAVVGLVGEQYTVRNPQLDTTLRPFSFLVPDALGADLQQSVQAKAGRMFGNIISYNVPVVGWRDPKGALWEPNTLVVLTAPGAMIYNPYTFVIRSVEFLGEPTRQTAILNLCLPGSFSGKIPESLPWDE